MCCFFSCFFNFWFCLYFWWGVGFFVWLVGFLLCAFVVTHLGDGLCIKWRSGSRVCVEHKPCSVLTIRLGCAPSVPRMPHDGHAGGEHSSAAGAEGSPGCPELL